MTRGTSRARAGLAVALLPMLLGGCGAPTAVAGDGPSEETSPSGTATTAPPHVSDLTCKTDMRSGGTFDFFTSTGGSETPEAAASARTEPGEGVDVQRVSKQQVVAYLLRPDGTAYSRLDIGRLSDDTWRVNGIESCSGEQPLPN